MEIQEIISKVRFKISDTDATRISNWQIMEAINEGHAYFRKTCMQKNPDMLASLHCGVLEPLHNLICVPGNAVKITNLRCEGRKLHPATTSEIRDLTSQGSPQKYVAKITGDILRLFVFPVPASAVNYMVEYVEEVNELKEEDSLEYPREYINLLIDYVCSRLTGAPADALAEFSTGLATLIDGTLPGPCVVDSYY